MNGLDELVANVCPDGVERVHPLAILTIDWCFIVHLIKNMSEQHRGYQG